MEMRFDHAGLNLARATLLRLRDARGLVVVCRAGKVWITLEGDTRDIALAQGESFVVDRDGLTLIEVVADADLWLSTAATVAPGRPWEALIGRLRAAFAAVTPTEARLRS